jgi:hypothetical protein
MVRRAMAYRRSWITQYPPPRRKSFNELGVVSAAKVKVEQGAG